MNKIEYRVSEKLPSEVDVLVSDRFVLELINMAMDGKVQRQSELDGSVAELKCLHTVPCYTKEKTPRDVKTEDKRKTTQKRWERGETGRLFSNDGKSFRKYKDELDSETDHRKTHSTQFMGELFSESGESDQEMPVMC